MDLELSIGDYVLTGGELPALVVVDAVLRLLPGAIEAGSLDDESFARGLLEYPQYTRPAVFDGSGVPDVLVSGDHGAVRRWRLRESIRQDARAAARPPRDARLEPGGGAPARRGPGRAPARPTADPAGGPAG